MFHRFRDWYPRTGPSQERLAPSQSRVAFTCFAVARDERGTVMVEYAIVLTLVSLALMTGMGIVENATANALAYVQTELMHYALRDNT